MKSKTGELILLLPVDAWPSLPFRLWCERHSVAIEDVAKRFTHTFGVCRKDCSELNVPGIRRWINKSRRLGVVAVVALPRTSFQFLDVLNNIQWLPSVFLFFRFIVSFSLCLQYLISEILRNTSRTPASHPSHLNF